LERNTVVLAIGEEATDPKVKLEASRIANDCYRFIMEMSTNAGVVSDALKFVNQSGRKINTMQKLDERIEATKEEREKEEQTTDGMY